MNLRLNAPHELVTLGLSAREAQAYALLLTTGSLTARHIAKETGALPNATYRTMRWLSEKGFVVTLPTRPITYQAVTPAQAVAAYTLNQQKRFEEVKLRAIRFLTENQKSGPQTRIDTITGKQEMFTAFTEQANQTKKEILVISIGENVPDEVKLTHRNAKERGVIQKLLFQKYDESNKEIIRSWQRMGIEVRYYPDWGFHLMVFDGKWSILVANNPKETAERTGMVIHSQGLSKALRDYFYSVWKIATPIKL